jgi:hypothetical protein
MAVCFTSNIPPQTGITPSVMVCFSCLAGGSTFMNMSAGISPVVRSWGILMVSHLLVLSDGYKPRAL